MALINDFKIIKYVSQDRATSCTHSKQSWRKTKSIHFTPTRQRSPQPSLQQWTPLTCLQKILCSWQSSREMIPIRPLAPLHVFLLGFPRSTECASNYNFLTVLTDFVIVELIPSNKTRNVNFLTADSYFVRVQKHIFMSTPPQPLSSSFTERNYGYVKKSVFLFFVFLVCWQVLPWHR